MRVPSPDVILTAKAAWSVFGDDLYESLAVLYWAYSDAADQRFHAKRVVEKWGRLRAAMEPLLAAIEAEQAPAAPSDLPDAA